MEIVQRATKFSYCAQNMVASKLELRNIYGGRDHIGVGLNLILMDLG